MGARDFSTRFEHFCGSEIVDKLPDFQKFIIRSLKPAGFSAGNGQNRRFSSFQDCAGESGPGMGLECPRSVCLACRTIREVAIALPGAFCAVGLSNRKPKNLAGGQVLGFRLKLAADGRYHQGGGKHAILACASCGSPGLL